MPLTHATVAAPPASTLPLEIRRRVIRESGKGIADLDTDRRVGARQQALRHRLVHKVRVKVAQIQAAGDVWPPRRRDLLAIQGLPVESTIEGVRHHILDVIQGAAQPARGIPHKKALQEQAGLWGYMIGESQPVVQDAIVHLVAVAAVIWWLRYTRYVSAGASAYAYIYMYIYMYF